jgi:hypothetical protein
MLIFEDKVTTNKSLFINKVILISQKLDIDPNWLMAVMNLETGGTFSPSIKNKTSGATGLIQFIPSTAESLGITTSALAKMSNVQQLDWVYKYLNEYKSKLVNYIDLYLAVFFPAALSKSNSFVIETPKQSASTIASQNSGFDLNKDKKITVGEIKSFYLKKIPAEWVDYFKNGKPMDSAEKFTKRNWFPIVIAVGSLAGALWIMYKYKNTIIKNIY